MQTFNAHTVTKFKQFLQSKNVIDDNNDDVVYAHITEFANTVTIDEDYDDYESDACFYYRQFVEEL